jgi:hypothetical protein
VLDDFWILVGKGWDLRSAEFRLPINKRNRAEKEEFEGEKSLDFFQSPQQR